MKPIIINLDEIGKIYVSYAYDNNYFGENIKMTKGKESFTFIIKNRKNKKSDVKDYVDYLKKEMPIFNLDKTDKYYNEKLKHYKKYMTKINQIIRKQKIKKLIYNINKF